MYAIRSYYVTGGALLFRYFYLGFANNEPDNDYSNFIKSKLLRITFTATLLLPILMFVNLIIVV